MKRYIVKPILLVIIFLLFFLVSCNKEETTSTTLSNEYTVELDPNGGSLDTLNMSITKGDPVELPEPLKKGRVFLGWYTGLDNESVKIESGTVIDKDYKLYAMWNKYDVTFYDGDNKPYYKETVLNGHRAFNPSKFPVEHLENDTTTYFGGWDFDFSTPIYKDYDVHSIWSNDKLVSIKVDLGSAFISGKEMVDIPYRDSYFLKPNTEFNKELALFALGSSLSNRNKSTLGTFITKAGFNNPYYAESYDSDEIENITYAFYHKSIDDFELITVCVK